MPRTEADPGDSRERAPRDKSQVMSALLLELATMPRRAEGWERVLKPGQIVGRFELVGEIGRGGFGIVYQARDRELGRSVAFKALRPGRGLEAGAERLLLQEAEAIAGLSHPNLVTLHDVGRCEQGPYLVLELLRGCTLGDRLRQGPIPVAEALRIGLDVVRGVAHAHQAGVIHRDLKPTNVFLCEGGLVKVLDFGMAHAFGRTRTLGGTPAYMAPEQWHDGAEDERTDVFAIGVMLHQMLHGCVPLPEGGKSLEAGPAPRLMVPECPALAELVARMLEREPARRPRNAAEVLGPLQALHQSLRLGEEETARRASLPRPRTLRAGWLAAAAIAGAMAVAAGAGIGLHLLGAPRAAPRVAVLPFTALTAGPDDASIAAGIHAELLTQLAQVAGLRVIGGRSVQEYAVQGPRDLASIARVLDASAVVEGTVQRQGDRLRIQAHLVDPRSGEERWAERFDRRADDLLDLQSEVAERIARVLGAKLSATERRRLERLPTKDPVAHDLYLKALYFWGRSSDDADRDRSRNLLQAAVERDQGFALAHAWLAVVETELAMVGTDRYPFQENCRSARLHAQRALALEGDLPQAHGALAEVRWACDGDNAGALEEFELQVRAAPGDGVARVNLGYTRMAMGRYSAATEDLRAAMALDPRSYFVAMLVAERMIQLRQFDDAERACRQAQELSPGDARAPAACALVAFWRDGDAGPARAALDAQLRQWSASNMAVESALELFYALPRRTLELAEAGQLPDPVSVDAPFVPLALLTGIAHQSLGQAEAARADFATVVDGMEAEAAGLRHRNDPATLGIQLLWLAKAHVGLGRGEEALREAREGLELITDLPTRTLALADVAEVAAVAGRPDRAVSLLAEVLDSPAGTMTATSVRNNPAFAALRGYPPFEALVAARLAGR
jgi:eukaryotic-like serine/threonine-protein kinase